jgi:hypothetical protein
VSGIKEAFILFYIGFLAHLFLQVLTINYVLTELCMVNNADNFDSRMTQTREHLNSVLSKSVLLNTAQSAR